MIASFSQTYSDNRSELFDYHNKNIVDINFRNKLDKNYYIFHNSPEIYVKKILEYDYFKKINNSTILTYNNITYNKTVFETLKKMKNDGIKYVFFLQDDVFLLVNDEIIDELLLFVKSNDFDMLNIEVSDINKEKPIIYSNNNLKIYNTDSNDFKNKKLWSFDDGPYVANIDFLLNNIYDSMYYKISDIWKGELYLEIKISNKVIQRLTTNYCIFKRFGIVGKNVDRTNHIKLLNDLFIN